MKESEGKNTSLFTNFVQFVTIIIESIDLYQ